MSLTHVHVQERTEEKRKIFVLAGGRNKKKTSEMEAVATSKQQPKKPSQYLPEVEQKRREPWRLYNGVCSFVNNILICLGPHSPQLQADHAPSLCPSDEKSLPSSVNSPTTESSPQMVQSTSRSKISKDMSSYPEQLSPHSKSSYRPSLGSVEEVSDNPPHSHNGEGPPPIPSQRKIGGVPTSIMGRSDRGDAWTMSGVENETTRSDKSSVDSNVGTPDELR